MEPINIFSIASKHNRWLAVREQTVAQNIANANTPGYKSVDVEPFEAALELYASADGANAFLAFGSVREQCGRDRDARGGVLAAPPFGQ